MEMYITGGLGAAAFLISILLGIRGHYLQRKSMKYLISDSSLHDLFHRAFFSELAEKNEFSSSLFDKALPQIKDAAMLLCNSSAIKLPRNLNALDDIIQNEIPKMRRLASPDYTIFIDNEINGKN